MSHLIMIGEGYPEGFANFEKTFDGKVYANGKAKVRIREMKIYTIAINEPGEKEFLSDIKSFIRGTGQTDRQTGEQMFQKIYKTSIYLNKFFKVMDPIDTKEIIDSGFRYQVEKQGIHMNMWLVPVGKVKDYEINGVEQV